MKSRNISIAFLLLAVVLIYTAAISSKVYLGDECFHYRFAKYFFQSGRPIQEPSYVNVPNIGYQFTAPIFWYWGLQAIWHLFNSTSNLITQAYQLFFYILLLISTYCLGRSVDLDDEQSLLSVWVAASSPMIVAFSIILYQDVPACAFTVLGMWLLLKRRYFLGGITYGVLILAKQYGFFLGPGILIAIFFFLEKKLLEKIANSVIFFGTAFLILLPDMIFRWKHFGFIYYSPPHPQYINKELTYWYVPASVTRDPISVLSYLGIAVFLGFIAYLFAKGRRKGLDWILLITSAIYCGLFGLFFPRTLDVRYFMPAICLLSPLAARGITRISSYWMRSFFYLIFIIQIVATCWVVHTRRQIPAGIEQGFQFIRTNTPSKSVVLYPAENITNYTGRLVVWAYVTHIQDLFWNPSPEKVEAAIKEAHIDFIVIPEERIYDDSKAHHLGGYPRSFVSRIKSKNEFPFIEEIFSNREISVWKIDKSK